MFESTWWGVNLFQMYSNWGIDSKTSPNQKSQQEELSKKEISFQISNSNHKLNQNVSVNYLW